MMSDWLALKKFLDHCSHEQLAYEMTAHGSWIVIWDADRILKQATKVGYNVPSYFGITENCDGTPATNESASKINKLFFMKSVVGLISRISGYKVIRINELV